MKIETKQLEYIDYQFSIEDGAYTYQGTITRPADAPLTEEALAVSIDTQYQAWRAVMDAPAKAVTVEDLALQAERLEKEIVKATAKLTVVRGKSAKLAQAEPIKEDTEVKRG